MESGRVRFLVLFRGLNPSPFEPNFEVEAVLKSFEEWSSDALRNPSIRQVYAFAGLRGGAMVVEVGSAEELHNLIANQHVWRMCSWEYYPIVAPNHLLEWITSVAHAMPANGDKNTANTSKRTFRNLVE